MPKETPEQRKNREQKLYDQNVLRNMQWKSLFREEDVKALLPHFYGENEEVSAYELRDHFIAYCIGVRGMTPDELGGKTKEEIDGLTKDFTSEMLKHPFMGENISQEEKNKNLAWYGAMYGKAMKAFENTKVPEGVATFDQIVNHSRQSQLLSGNVGMGLYQELPDEWLEDNSVFLTAFKKENMSTKPVMSRAGLVMACYRNALLIAANPEESLQNRVAYKLLLEQEYEPALKGKQFTALGSNKSYYGSKKLSEYISDLDDLATNCDFSTLTDEECYEILDTPLDQLREKNLLLYDKTVNLLQKNFPNKAKIKDLPVPNEEELRPARRKEEERKDNLEREKAQASKREREKHLAEERAYYDERIPKAAPYRKELEELKKQYANLPMDKISALSIGSDELATKPYLDQLFTLKSPEERKQCDQLFDQMFEKLQNSQQPLLNEKYHSYDNSFIGQFRITTADGKYKDAGIDTFLQNEGAKAGIGDVMYDRSPYFKGMLLGLMARKDVRVEYRPTVYWRDGRSRYDAENISISHPEVTYDGEKRKHYTEEERQAWEDEQIRQIDAYIEEKEKEQNEILEKEESERQARAKVRAKEEAYEAEQRKLTVGNERLTEEQFFQRAYGNGWNKERDQKILDSIVTVYQTMKPEYINIRNPYESILTEIASKKLLTKKPVTSRDDILKRATDLVSDRAIDGCSDNAKRIIKEEKRKLYESIKSSEPEKEKENRADAQKEYMASLDKKGWNKETKRLVERYYTAVFDEQGNYRKELKAVRDKILSSKSSGSVTDLIHQAIESIPSQERTQSQRQILSVTSHIKEKTRLTSAGNKALPQWRTCRGDVMSAVFSAGIGFKEDHSYRKLLEEISSGKNRNFPDMNPAKEETSFIPTNDILRRAAVLLKRETYSPERQVAIGLIEKHLEKTRLSERSEALQDDNKMKRLAAISDSLNNRKGFPAEVVQGIKAVANTPSRRRYGLYINDFEKSITEAVTKLEAYEKTAAIDDPALTSVREALSIMCPDQEPLRGVPQAEEVQPAKEDQHLASKFGVYLAQMRNNIKDEMDIVRYGELYAKLEVLAELSRPYEGKEAKPVDKEGFEKLNEGYTQALEACRDIIEKNSNYEISAQMKELATGLQNVLSVDRATLESAKEQQGRMLDDIIEDGRSMTVDIGNQEVSTVGAAMSSRIPMKVVGKDGRVREGYFTKSSYLETEKSLQDLFDKEEKENPRLKDLYSYIRAMSDDDQKKLGVSARLGLCVNEGSKVLYGKEGVNPKSAEECEKMALEGAKKILKVYVPENLVERMSQVPGFVKAVSHLAPELMKIHGARTMYNGNARGNLNLPEGVNIDKRNAAMSSVASLLGKPQIIAKSEPMILKTDGDVVTGTFMETAHGFSPDIVSPDNPLAKIDKEALDSPYIFEDLASIQALDYICGNIDRHAGNYMVRFDEVDGKLMAVGLTGIDNDMSFGNFGPELKSSALKFPMPQNMGVIGAELANTILLLDEETLKTALKGYGLSQEEQSAAWRRTRQLQDQIVEGLDYFRDKEPGVVAEGHLRVVPSEEWKNYHLSDLASMRNQFRQFSFVGNYYKNKIDGMKLIDQREKWQAMIDGKDPQMAKKEVKQVVATQAAKDPKAAVKGEELKAEQENAKLQQEKQKAVEEEKRKAEENRLKEEQRKEEERQKEEQRKEEQRKEEERQKEEQRKEEQRKEEERQKEEQRKEEERQKEAQRKEEANKKAEQDKKVQEQKKAEELANLQFEEERKAFVEEASGRGWKFTKEELGTFYGLMKNLAPNDPNNPKAPQNQYRNAMNDIRSGNDPESGKYTLTDYPQYATQITRSIFIRCRGLVKGLPLNGQQKKQMNEFFDKMGKRLIPVANMEISARRNEEWQRRNVECAAERLQKGSDISDIYRLKMNDPNNRFDPAPKIDEMTPQEKEQALAMYDKLFAPFEDYMNPEKQPEIKTMAESLEPNENAPSRQWKGQPEFRQQYIEQRKIEILHDLAADGKIDISLPLRGIKDAHGGQAFMEVSVESPGMTQEYREQLLSQQTKQIYEREQELNKAFQDDILKEMKTLNDRHWYDFGASAEHKQMTDGIDDLLTVTDKHAINYSVDQKFDTLNDVKGNIEHYLKLKRGEHGNDWYPSDKLGKGRMQSAERILERIQQEIENIEVQREADNGFEQNLPKVRTTPVVETPYYQTVKDETGGVGSLVPEQNRIRELLNLGTPKQDEFYKFKSRMTKMLAGILSKKVVYPDPKTADENQVVNGKTNKQRYEETFNQFDNKKVKSFSQMMDQIKDFEQLKEVAEMAVTNGATKLIEHVEEVRKAGEQKELEQGEQIKEQEKELQVNRL